MSCRETHGNSAVTSLAKFLTGATEQSVSRVFHQLKRESALVLGDQANDSADAREVLTFLRASLATSKTDSRIRESRRPSLKARLDAAIADTTRGENLPSKATFRAWQALESALRAAPADVSAVPAQVPEDPSVGRTPEGLAIGLGDVLAARRKAEQLHARALGGNGAPTPANFAPFNSRAMDPRATREYLLAKERADKLEAAYDATDTGFALLMQAPESDSSMPGHGPWRSRMQVAKATRKEPNVIAAMKAEAQVLGEEAARQKRDDALAVAKTAENMVRMQDNPSTRSTYDAAVKEFHSAQRTWLYAVASDPVIAAAAENDLTHASTWQRLTGSAAVSRFDCWRAAELLRTDIDRAEIRVGRISEVTAASRAVDRAEARQSILDQEGNNEVDPVNRRFAESVRLRRRTSKVGAR